MGCQEPILLKFTFHSLNDIGPKHPVLCFLYDQNLDYCKNTYQTENVGCPYRSCFIHTSTSPYLSFPHPHFYRVNGRNSRNFTLKIPDTWNSCWTQKVQGAMYWAISDWYPTSKIYIYRALALLSTMTCQGRNHLNTTTGSKERSLLMACAVT